MLTTFKTLRDYDKDSGQVRFAAPLFDEAWKIKTPGVRLTDAAKLGARSEADRRYHQRPAATPNDTAGPAM